MLLRVWCLVLSRAVAVGHEGIPPVVAVSGVGDRAAATSRISPTVAPGLIAAIAELTADSTASSFRACSSFAPSTITVRHMSPW